MQEIRRDRQGLTKGTGTGTRYHRSASPSGRRRSCWTVAEELWVPCVLEL